LHKAEHLSLKNHPSITERWLHDHLIADPSLLGLGDLDVRDSERQQPGAGRLDLLLADPETRTRYEVEIQLGAMDESHIIRTTEYWDIERRRYPQYEHVAVLVAENVTSRFLNVVSLFNGFIPLVVIQLQGIEVNGAFTLVATRVVDTLPLGTEEEEEEGSGTADRSYWEQKASPASVQLVDELAGLVQAEVESELQLNYAKRSIRLVQRGLVRTFVTFVPRKQHVVMRFKLPQSEELTELFEASVFKMLTYSQNARQYRITVDHAGLETGRAELTHFIRAAHDASGA
ncbi:MAG: hypothetical protein OXG18_12020, partial [Gemmatimonadetes bacterium]|nr:hypothetical protein [Gemmatimonadota bacterium]